MPIVIRFLYASRRLGGEDVHIYDRGVKSTGRFLPPLARYFP
jgi:hypothetical protein